jgi:hypothetical protein
MGYIMRYFTTSALRIQIDILREVVHAIDPAYTLEDTDLARVGQLRFAGQVLGTIEINLPDEEIFQDDVDSFLDVLGAPTNEAEQAVETVLKTTTALVVAEVHWEGTDSEPALSKFDPIWDWLFVQRPGVLQADQEGFYNRQGLLVERRFTL